MTRWLSPTLFSSLIGTTLIVFVVAFDWDRNSPGPLSATHAQIPKLIHKDGCSLCHGKGTTSMHEACLECHQDIARQLNDRLGLHGRLESQEARRCEKCHLEHLGRDFKPLNAISFAKAGVKNMETYTHKGIVFTLVGKHAEQTCNACHPNANASVLPEGEHRFLGLNQQCVSCHADVHKGACGNDCESCHGQEKPFKDAPSFKHVAAIDMSGAHGKVTCVECHKSGTPTSVANLYSRMSKGESISERTCENCHPSPHNSSILAGFAKKLGMKTSDACGSCHKPDHFTFRRPKARMDAALHEVTGFALTAPHDRECKACHGDATSTLTFKARYPGRKQDSCTDCHKNPHISQFGHPFRNLDCRTCHKETYWKPHTFTVDMHDRTNFKLEGSHRATACDDCHKTPEGAKPYAETGKLVRQFKGTPSKCSDCHGDVHQGLISADLRENCQTCHTMQTFKRTTITSEKHDTLTSFKLKGAHVAVSCNACHKINQQLPKTRLSRRVYKGTPKSCKACHTDPHDGVFDRDSAPKTMNDRLSCERCHIETGWRMLKQTSFDHGKWTGFELVGKHAAAKCSACHVPITNPKMGERSFAKAKGRKCVDCHQDPHAGQFIEAGQNRCDRCHTEKGEWKNLVFNHNQDSRFKLDEKHAILKCSSCHKPVHVSNGEAVIKYKPLKKECGDCHQFRERSSKKAQ